jgi:alpha-N-acetylglucosaminidase
LFLRELGASLGSNKPFDEKEFQSRLRRWMADWSDQREVYPTQPQGDSVQAARTLWAKYKKQLGRA